jgi:hypothetical protein
LNNALIITKWVRMVFGARPAVSIEPNPPAMSAPAIVAA